MTPNTATTWPIADLHGWDKNPRGIKKEDFERLKRQITAHGQFKPVLVTADGEVLGGNMRLKAYQALGIQDVWVSVVTPKDETEKIAIALADNDRAGYYEEDALAELIMSVPDLVLEDYHLDLGKTISAKDLVYRFSPEGSMPEVPNMEPPLIAESKVGDLYSLGAHRLLCGDSQDNNDMKTLMDGEKAACVFTDPPYALFGNSTGISGVVDDKMVRPFFLGIFQNIQKYLIPFGHSYVCCDWHSAFVLQEMAAKAGLTPKNLCIWDKGDGGLGGMYQQCYEMIWLFANSPISKNTTGNKIAGERTINGKPNIWRYGRVSERSHNAQKPEKMVAEAIRNSTTERENVLDMFGGSGTTLLAAESVGRSCYMMELDPKYCDVIIKRWEQFTGEQAIKLTEKDQK